MNTKKWIIAGLTAALMSTGAAYAQSTEAPATVRVIVANQGIMDMQAVKDLLQELAAEGYTYIEVGRTFLGRADIKAYNGEQMREIVMNATTGEIMRDMMQEHAGMPDNGNMGGEGSMGGNEGNMGGEGSMGGSEGNMSGEDSMNSEGGSPSGAAGNMGSAPMGGMGGN